VTISIFKRGEGATSTTFDLAKDARIQRDGKDAKLADLKTGSQATLTLSKDQKTVVALSVTSPAIAAPLKSVDAAKNTITVTVGTRAGKEDKTYQVSKDARITVDGKAAQLADLKVGTTLTFSVDEANTVIQVRTAARGLRKQE
jgi:hypothetical protein